MKTKQRITAFAAVCLFSFFVIFFASAAAEAYAAVTADVPVYCREVSGISDHTYKIKIEPESAGAPAPVSDTLEIAENGTGHIAVSVTEPGTYSYKVYEAAGKDAKIKYDGRIYGVTLYVENGADGELKCTVYLSQSGKTTKPEKIEFGDTVSAGSDTDPAKPTTTTKKTTTTTAAKKSDNSKSNTPADSSAKSANAQNTGKGDSRNAFTGDSFPAYALWILLAVSFITAASAFLFKRRSGGEEDQRE